MLKPRAIKAIKSVDEFRAYLAERGIDLVCDDTVLAGSDSPLTQPLTVYGKTLGNRWTAHPMEGWDGTRDGHITEPMKRRWQRFGISGAKIVWGGEAMAVRYDGRANPNQLMIVDETEKELALLRDITLQAHKERYGSADDVYIGFQLTHSGRFSRPDGEHAPRVAYRHPILDGRVGGIEDANVFTDDELKILVEDYVKAAVISHRVSADFVDVKCCHGYLLHEFLGAHTRPGMYGGSFENRTRLFREIVDGIRSEAPGLQIGVRLSAFDVCPFKPDPEKTQGSRLGPGIPDNPPVPYEYGFAVNRECPTEFDLTEAVEFLKFLESLDITFVNLTAGSPYYCPHVQRPALMPPSDGYAPPEDPLAGVARQINAAAELKKQFPGMVLIGTGYTYLQEYLPHVAQHYLREGLIDSVGIGRMLLPYPDMLADATEGKELRNMQICRTISDCTTGPRKGLPSGCYPLDDYYKGSEDAEKLRKIKRSR